MIGILGALILGAALVYAFSPRAPRRWDWWILAVGLAITLGFGTASIVFFVCRFFGFSGWLALGLEVAAAGVLVFVHPKVVTMQRQEDHGPAIVPVWMLAIAAVLVVSISAAALAGAFEQNPQGGWDAWAIYNLRAKYLTGEQPSNAWSAQLVYTQPRHPLLVSGIVGQGWSLSGSYEPAVPMAIAALFLASLLCTGVGALALIRGPMAAMLLLLGLSSFAPLWREAATQYSDVPLTCYLLAASALWLLAGHLGSRALFVLSGVCTGLAAWTKNEGLLFVVLFFAITVIWRRRALLLVAAGMVPPLLIVGWFKLFLAPAAVPIGPSALTGSARLAPILSAFGSEFLSLGTGWLHPILPLVLLAAALRFDPRASRTAVPLVAAAAGMLAGYFGVYLLSSEDLDFLIGGSLGRLYVQVVPVLLFGFFASVALGPIRR